MPVPKDLPKLGYQVVETNPVGKLVDQLTFLKESDHPQPFEILGKFLTEI